MKTKIKRKGLYSKTFKRSMRKVILEMPNYIVATYYKGAGQYYKLLFMRSTREIDNFLYPHYQTKRIIKNKIDSVNAFYHDIRIGDTIGGGSTSWRGFSSLQGYNTYIGLFKNHPDLLLQ